MILHRDYAGGTGQIEAFTRQKLGQPIYEDAQFGVFRVSPYHGDPPGFLTDAQGDGLYFYAPQPGSASMSGSVALAASITLDDQALAKVDSRFNLPISFAAGYHTITIANDPACPTNDDPALECPALNVEGLTLGNYQPTHGGS